MDVHAELEEALARFKGAEACLTFSSGYLANLGILETSGLPGGNDLFGRAQPRLHRRRLPLSRARVEVYRHADPGHLEDLLKASSAKRKIIVTDGLFSMEGHRPASRSAGLKEKYGAIMVVDDAHATGMLPPRGRGSADYFASRGKSISRWAHSPRPLARTGHICARRARSWTTS